MKREALLTAIKSIMLGIEKTGKIVGMDFLVFDNDFVRSFKDEVSVSYPLETGVDGAVHAEEFFKVLSKMGEEDVELSIEEGRIKLKDKQTCIWFNSLEPRLLGEVKARACSLLTDLEWYELPKDFIEGLNLCLFGSSTDRALEDLSGINITESQITSTDDMRMSFYIMEGPVVRPFTIPVKTAQSLVELETEFSSIALTKSWAHLYSKEEAVFSVRLMSHKYDLGQLKDMAAGQKYGPKDAVYTFPKGIMEALTRAQIFAQKGPLGIVDVPMVSIEYSDKNLVITASRQIGEILEHIPWKDKPMPEGIIIWSQPDFLTKVLKVTDSFKIAPSRKSILFSKKNFQHFMAVTIKK